MMTQKEFVTKQDSAKKESFRRWMQEPMTRAMLSTIAPCEQLEVLLQAAFETGFGSGSGATALYFLDIMLSGPPR